jgi:3-phenylpropionate/trans-cinnamate dioxygenase ferredoxin subunit
MARQHVGRAGDIPEGQAVVVDAGDRRLALCNVGGEVHAIDDICTHDGGPLGEGELFGYQIECPRHGARFDVRTGQVTQMPAVRPVRTYPVEREGDDLYVDVPDDEW